MVAFACHGFWEFYMNLLVSKNVKNALVTRLGFYIRFHLNQQ